MSTSAAAALLQQLLKAVGNRNFSDPDLLLQLPFPAVHIEPPSRFRIQPGRLWTYMGRRKYLDVRNTLLGLCTDPAEIMDLPVRPDKLPTQRLDMEGALWGTMGSGKSYILAALACELLATFHRNSRLDKGGKVVQVQRVAFLPDCSQHHRLRYIQEALELSYADEDETLGRIATLSDDDSIVKFFFQEFSRGVRLYLIVDQVNALDSSAGDDVAHVNRKGEARALIASLGSDQPVLQGASANNANAKIWTKNQLSISRHFLFGGLVEEEYRCWKKHFGTRQAVSCGGGTGAAMEIGSPKTPLGLLSEEEELRVKDATGCVPLFLLCWSGTSDDDKPAETPEQAWELFVRLDEVEGAGTNLRELIEEQLDGGVHHKSRLDMYIGFMTGGSVRASAQHYDCRYMYVDRGVGSCVCGVFRNLIAEVVQHLQRSAFLESQWKQAIARESAKPNPNPALLGFMVEQEMLTQIWHQGIPLYAEIVQTCDHIVYFSTGSEAELELKEGCTLYVPSAFNYPRVDAIVREWKTPPAGRKFAQVYRRKDKHPKLKEMLESYQSRCLHVAAVQISLGGLKDHSNSESEFWAPEVGDDWCHGVPKEDVARWFVWYVRQSEIDAHSTDGQELDPYHYASREIRGKTRAASVQERDHITVFLPVEQFEPCLKKTRGEPSLKKET